MQNISDNPNPKPLNSLNSFCVTSDLEVLQGTLPDMLTNILLFYSFYLSGDTFIIPSNHLTVSQGIPLRPKILQLPKKHLINMCPKVRANIHDLVHDVVISVP